MTPLAIWLCCTPDTLIKIKVGNVGRVGRMINGIAPDTLEGALRESVRTECLH